MVDDDSNVLDRFALHFSHHASFDLSSENNSLSSSDHHHILQHNHRSENIFIGGELATDSLSLDHHQHNCYYTNDSNVLDVSNGVIYDTSFSTQDSGVVGDGTISATSVVDAVASAAIDCPLNGQKIYSAEPLGVSAFSSIYLLLLTNTAFFSAIRFNIAVGRQKILHLQRLWQSKLFFNSSFQTRFLKIDFSISGIQLGLVFETTRCQTQQRTSVQVQILSQGKNYFYIFL
jgi:hypothetical protein